jgi:anion-transporting  ArsA/GET3 family ATPase
MSLFDRRLIVVLGKGGVGKTTVTAAIALAAARSGRSALAVEVASQHRLARIFDPDAEPDFSETPLQPGLTGLSIDPQRALEEYVALALRVRVLAERLAESKGLAYVASAAPGLRELVTLGKVWHLTEQKARDGSPRYDLVVLDAPATGHGIGLLRTPRQFADIARVGRINAEARAVSELIHDRSRTGLVLVTLPEEMPVSETADALDRLRAIELEADCVVVNGLYPTVLSEADGEAFRALRSLGPTGTVAAEAALSHLARQRQQRAELDRLAVTVDLPRVELPFLFVPELDVDAVADLSALLGPALEEIA